MAPRLQLVPSPDSTAAADRALQSAVRLMASHGRLAAAAAAGGDAARERRLLTQQGMILLMAGLQLMDEGGAS